MHKSQNDITCWITLAPNNIKTSNACCGKLFKLRLMLLSVMRHIVISLAIYKLLSAIFWHPPLALKCTRLTYQTRWQQALIQHGNQFRAEQSSTFHLFLFLFTVLWKIKAVMENSSSPFGCLKGSEYCNFSCRVRRLAPADWSTALFLFVASFVLL